jgi:hypothetical protein
MFFRKKRAAEKEARDLKREKILEDFDNRLDEAEALSDPAEKLLKLKRLEDDIEKTSKDMWDDANGAVFMRGFGTGFGIFGASTAGAIWLAVGLSNPWLGLVIIPGTWAATKIGVWRAERLEDRLHEENFSFAANLGGRKGVLTTLTDKILKNDWSAIAKSPKAKDAAAAYPALSEKFAAAFCKSAKENDVAAPAPAPVANDHDAKDAVVVQEPIEVKHSLKFKRRAP